MTTAAIVLPPMHDLVLDGAAVDQLFFDLVQAATAIEIIARAPGARRADPAAPWTIDTAHAALRTGALAAVQLRYDFAGSRLVRHPPANARGLSPRPYRPHARARLSRVR